MWQYSLPGLDHAYHSQLQNERNPPGNVARALDAAPFSLSLSPLRTAPFGLDRRYSASVTTLTAEQELLVSKLKAGVGPFATMCGMGLRVYFKARIDSGCSEAQTKGVDQGVLRVLEENRKQKMVALP